MNHRGFENIIPEIERIVAVGFAKERLPGLAIGIVRDRDLAWSKGFGHADLDAGQPPDEHTVARVASVTKTFTTTAILQLRDDGLLALDDPLVAHIPEFAAARARAGSVEQVTIRRLLTHRSGLVTEAPALRWNDLHFPSVEAILAALPQTGIVIPADSAWKYSNLGFALLGEVIARLSGRPFVDYVTANILQPLGLESTVFELTDALRPRFFAGYSPALYEDRPRRAPYARLNGVTPAGQLHSTVHDIARWISFQFRTDGGERTGAQVLRGDSLEEMHRPQYVEPDWSAAQCLGWRATRVGDRVYHNHGGGLPGFTTAVWFNKPARTGVVALANLWPGSGAVERIVTDVLEAVLPADAASVEEPSRPPPCPTPEALRPLVGPYVAHPLAIRVNVEYRESALRLVPPPGEYSFHAPADLEPTDDPNAFTARGGRASGETAVFQRVADGAVRSFYLAGVAFTRLTTHNT